MRNRPLLAALTVAACLAARTRAAHAAEPALANDAAPTERPPQPAEPASPLAPPTSHGEVLVVLGVATTVVSLATWTSVLLSGASPGRDNTDLVVWDTTISGVFLLGGLSLWAVGQAMAPPSTTAAYDYRRRGALLFRGARVAPIADGRGAWGAVEFAF